MSDLHASYINGALRAANEAVDKCLASGARAGRDMNKTIQDAQYVAAAHSRQLQSHLRQVTGDPTLTVTYKGQKT